MFQWFKSNHMKVHTDKGNLLVTGDIEASVNIN